MTKRNKIIYWAATVWLALGMVSTAIVQLIRTQEETVMMQELGYPLYILTMIGVWKMLGTIAVLAPGLPLIKEWAYAGFFFLMSGAIVSHMAVGDKAITCFGPILLLALTIVSWYFRPSDRKLIGTTHH